MTTNSQGLIESLEPFEIFVFGSNAQGQHIGGAAKQAEQHFGAVHGIGHGLMGQSYAIDTMSGLDNIRLQVIQFKRIAELLLNYTFYLTPIGTGIAGYSLETINNLLGELPTNVKKVGWDE